MKSGIRWDRTVATAFTALFVCYAVYSTAVNIVAPKGVDFVSFWAAAKLALQGTPALAYDVAAHRAVELTAGPVDGLLPFPYPPPFLLAVLPFGLASMAVALPLWLTVSAAFYVLALRRWAPLPYAFAHPAVTTNALIGQTGLLTTGIFAAALSAFDRRPFFSGALFGLLIIKPQLGLLLPLAFIAGREWRAFCGAAVSASALLLVGLLAFGWSAYESFLHHLPMQASFIRNGDVPWNEVASTFALLRWAGASEGVALAIHSMGAAWAAFVTWLAWRENHEQRGSVLAAATLLISPYLLTYDTLLLVLPVLVLWRQQRSRPLALVWILALIPVIIHSIPAVIPNTAPLAAVTCLLMLRPATIFVTRSRTCP
jgi:hypothetical protein